MPNRSPHLRFLAMAVIIGAFSTLSIPVDARPGKTAVSIPTSIDATGDADVTGPLNAFFASVPDDTSVQFPTSGRYRVEGTLQLTDLDRVTLEGNQSMLFATTRGSLKRIHVEILGGSSIRIHNLAIKGAHPNGGLEDGAYQADVEGQHGIAVRGTRGLDLDHIAITDTFGDFIYLSSDASGWSEQVWIHDSIFARNGRQGIAIIASRNLVIEDNTFDEVARTTFDVEPNGPNLGGENIHIINNDVGTGRLLFLAVGGLGRASGLVISGNKLTGHPLNIAIWPPRGVRDERIWIVGNRGGNSASRTPIKADRVDGLVVWRNSQPIRDGEVGVRPTQSCGVTVSENDFGPFTDQVARQTEICGTELGPVPPDPPAVYGRPVAAEPEPQLPGGSGADDSDASKAAPIVAIQEEPQDWSITLTLGLLAAFMVGAAAIVRFRRH